jgi:rhodanese-related sulfurtransferase
MTARPMNGGGFVSVEGMVMATEISIDELRAWKREGRSHVLVDVLPEEAFAERHLPGAQRACVYEVDFLDQIRRLAIADGQTIVLYGAAPDSHEAMAAAEKLERAGINGAKILRGGMAGWQSAGEQLEGTPRPVSAPLQDGLLKIDSARSSIVWIGRSLASTHHGTIRIADGEVAIRAGVLASGRVILDMTSITDVDIPDPQLQRMLEAHLKSDDFFDVERFPTAELLLKGAGAIAGATPGAPNFTLRAALTVKDVTREIEFPAIIAEDPAGTLTGVAQVEIDRVEWNVCYGSGRLFRMLGKHLVNDTITLLVKIVAV